MGRGLDPVWEFYYRIDQDVHSLGLKSKANTAHNNGWCRNCVRATVNQLLNWQPDHQLLVEAGNEETARRYKAMSELTPLTGVPSRLRSHLMKCPHSRHVEIPPASVQKRKTKGGDGASGSRHNLTGTPTKGGKFTADGRFGEEEQGEFNVHLYHLFVALDIPFDLVSNPTLQQFVNRYIPGAGLPSRSLFYTLNASRSMGSTAPTLSAAQGATGGSPDFQGLAKLAANFAAVPMAGVGEQETEEGEMAYQQ
ncbi:hypothetical protein L202_05392 [Cryptococcus amylolentus CBS 6039]|uniref:Uncharacterized protein n=2 Tax=Cryptococcus amylolentus TaxID=104669 RepID=A0A1E3HMX9_9TREE|nr:hypothetical protein L202_05392 [Cryptococcus amylolentus CBS 6039]ODN76791.1 hypothetical protein L202_05392 [Cryptococcus amylolentus CBS 6039]ODO04713.1 hypothetical protein I350_05322 [Cryptococcus amylolentus CBS 6273]